MRSVVRVLSMLVLVAAVSAAIPAEAADWYRQPSHTTAVATPVSTSGPTTAKAVQEALGGLGLGGLELGPGQVVPVAGANVAVRYGQTHRGVPVLSTSATFVVKGDGRIAWAVLQVEDGLTVDVRPSVSPEKAAVAVEGSEGGLPTVGGRANLAVLPDAARGGRLVWVFDVPTASGGVRFLVDAHDGGVVDRREMARNVRGRVYLENPVRTPDLTDVELTDLDVGDPQYLNGWGGNLRVTNFRGLAPITGAVLMQQTLEPNENGDFLYDPPEDPLDPADAFAQVSIFYHLTRGRDYFRDRVGLEMSGEDWRLAAVANVMDGDYPLDNAFFSPIGVESGPFAAPGLIAIGQGSQLDFALDSDVFLHEFTHYVTDNAIGYNLGQFEFNSYGRNPFSGAIDEAIADYFASTINDDPLLAESALGTFGVSRDLRDDSARCPSDVIGEVHEDGRIIGAAAWKLREAFGVEVGDQLVWGGTALVPAGGTFGDWGRGIAATSELMMEDGSLSASQGEQTTAILRGQGIEGCDQEIELREGESQSLIAIGLDWYTQFTGRPCSALQDRGVEVQTLFHFVARPNPDDLGLRFKVTYDAFHGEGLKWNLYGRANEHVLFEQGQGHFPRPVLSEWDYETLDLDGREGELVIDADSDPAFDPNATYYIVLINQSCSSGQATFSVEHIAPEPVIEDPPATNDGEDPGPTNNAIEPDDDGADPGQSPFIGDDTVAVRQVGGGGCACNVPSPASPRPLIGWMALATAALGWWLVRRS